MYSIKGVRFSWKMVAIHTSRSTHHTHKAYHHGQHAVAQPAQAAGQHVHDAAQQIEAANQAQPLGAGGDDRSVRGVEAQQLVPRQCCATAQHKAGHHDTQQTVADHPVEVVVLARADILAGKGNSGLCKGVHGGVHKALQIGGSRVARHHHGAEGVDGRLDDHIGKAEHRALQPGRQADEQKSASASRRGRPAAAGLAAVRPPPGRASRSPAARTRSG